MKKNEQKLLKNYIKPSGSSITHCIVIDKKTNKIISVEKKSLSWYKKISSGF